METVLVHTRQKGEEGRAAFEITFNENNTPLAAIYTAGNATKMVALNPEKLRKVTGRKYQYIYDDFVSLDYTDQVRGISLEDGWYWAMIVVRHRNKNKPGTYSVQVINGEPRMVTEWMVQHDKNDLQVKEFVPLDASRLEKMNHPTCNFFYQPQVIVPDEIDLELLRG